jgi:hypothetical protein
LDSNGVIQDGLADSDNDCSWVAEYKQFHKEQRGAEGAKYLVFGCFHNQGKTVWRRAGGGDASREQLMLHGQARPSSSSGITTDPNSWVSHPCHFTAAGKCPGLGDRFRGMEFAAKIAVHTKRYVALVDIMRA